MSTATLNKWGNGQGIRIPKEVCDRIGVKIGARATMVVSESENTISFSFEKEPTRFQRRSKVAMKELAAGWTGGKTGEEWGGSDVGSEVVE